MMGFDAVVQRLQNISSFNIYEVRADGSVAPWYEVAPADVIPTVVVNENDVLEQVQTLSGRIGHWGRLVAQCKRVWQIEERGYRVWRDTKYLNIVQTSEKKPTEKIIDATIRADPEYSVWYQRMERAEEAYNAAGAVLDAFRMKKEALRIAAYRRNEEGASILGI
jgi:hypothetical protein